MKNFSQISVKTALCGVVGSERVFKRVWDTSQQAKSAGQAVGADRQIYGKGYPFPMLAPKLLNLANTERKGKEWNGNRKSRTANLYRKRESQQKKPSATKSAALTMKCLPPAADRNGSATR